MYRVKQWLGGKLSLKNYNAQVGETYAMIKVLNKLTRLGIPKNSVYCLRAVQLRVVRFSVRVYATKPVQLDKK